MLPAGEIWSVVTESPRLSSTEAPTTLCRGGSSLVCVGRNEKVKGGGRRGEGGRGSIRRKREGEKIRRGEETEKGNERGIEEGRKGRKEGGGRGEVRRGGKERG